MTLRFKSSPAMLARHASLSTADADGFLSPVPQDLGSSDLRKDVYIVVHIVRIGGRLLCFS